MRQRLSILIYHRVLDKHDFLRPSDPDIQRFDRQMKWVKNFFNVLDLADAVAMLAANNLPERALCITFDDGYKDNYQNAFPVLKKHGLAATFFIATGFLDNGIMWNDTVIESLRNTGKEELDLRDYGLSCFNINNSKPESLDKIINELKYLSFDERKKLVSELPDLLSVSKPDGLMMTEKEVKELFQGGMGIGGHTVNHPILNKINAQQAMQELKSGKQTLEKIINERITLFAYPNGKPEQDYQREHVDMVRQAGFDAAVTTAWGVATKESDFYQLPRFTPWDKSITKYLLRLAKMRYSSMEARL